MFGFITRRRYLDHNLNSRREHHVFISPVHVWPAGSQFRIGKMDRFSRGEDLYRWHQTDLYKFACDIVYVL